MSLIPVIKNDELVVMGPPASVAINVDIGPTGERGSIIFSSSGDPSTNTTFYSTSNPPKAGDLYLRTDIGDYYGTIYRLTTVPGGTAWQQVLKIVNNYDHLAEFFNSSPNYVDTFIRDTINTSFQLTSGRLYLSTFTPIENTTIGNISVTTDTAGSSLTIAQFGIYTIEETKASESDLVASSTSLSLVAKTASDITLLTSANTLYTKSLSTAGNYPATYTLSAGIRYAVGVLVAGTTMPEVNGRDYGASSIIASMIPASSMYVDITDPATNGIPASTTSDITFTTKKIYARLS